MVKVIGVCILALAFAQPGRADETPWSVNRRMLSCPEAVVAKQPFAVAVAPGAGRELALRRAADGAWFFLAVALPPLEQGNLLSPERLRRGARVHIPAGMRWPKWAAHAKPEPVLRPGLYELYVSENLESELGGYKCQFRVTGLSPNNSSKPTPLRGAA